MEEKEYKEFQIRFRDTIAKLDESQLLAIAYILKLETTKRSEPI